MTTRASAGMGRRGRSGGFSLIEVLVALLVLALGLLGFALLQTMNLRYTQSANHRTVATNLAADLIDQMRSNRFTAAYYAGSSGAGFDAGEISGDDCTQEVGTVTIAENIEQWQCRVVSALGDSAAATVTYAGGTVIVTLRWGERIDPGPGQSTSTAFELTSQL